MAEFKLTHKAVNGLSEIGSEKQAF